MVPTPTDWTGPQWPCHAPVPGPAGSGWAPASLGIPLWHCRGLSGFALLSRTSASVAFAGWASAARTPCIWPLRYTRGRPPGAQNFTGLIPACCEGVRLWTYTFLWMARALRFKRFQRSAKTADESEQRVSLEKLAKAFASHGGIGR